MGTKYNFRCAACGYGGRFSGGPDVGMCAATATVVCRACRQLFDVEISDSPWAPKTSKPLRTIPCPCCAGYSLKRWRHPGPCPKCSHVLDRSGPVLVWD